MTLLGILRGIAICAILLAAGPSVLRAAHVDLTARLDTRLRSSVTCAYAITPTDSTPIC